MSADWLGGPESVGAAAGAGVAVLHTFKRDGKIISLTRFISGFIFGAEGTPQALTWLGWEHSAANTLFVASGIGLAAFIVVQAVLAEGTRKMAQKGAQAVIGKVTGVKNES